jgi:2-amino-4-hydroxy-6-hydroxymethyldihydropteridine diphosphokinase
MTNYTFLGLGSNLGDRLDYLNSAVGLIEKKIGMISSRSKVYETEPWGFKSENYFLNMVVKVHTGLKPFDLLKKIRKIEDQLGRFRDNKQYISRTIDIDILLYSNIVLDKPELIIPHALLQDRRFVLVPLCDVAPKMIHPVLSKTFTDLLLECDDKRLVKEFEAN